MPCLHVPSSLAAGTPVDGAVLGLNVWAEGGAGPEGPRPGRWCPWGAGGSVLLSPQRSEARSVRELRAVGVLWLPPPHRLWSPGVQPVLVNPSAAKALGGRGCCGSPGQMDGPAGRRDRRARPENASRRRGSPHGAHSVQWARPAQAGWPPGPLDTRPRLKGPWPEKGVTNPTMRPRAQAPGQCPQTASTSDPGTPSLPATAQKAASGTSSVSD